MSADAEMGKVIEGEAAAPPITKMDVFMSPQDVIIECKGERIRTHGIVLRRCKYFATLLEDADLETYGSERIKVISLPPTFDHAPSAVREFVMVLYDILDNDIHHIGQGNVISLAQLAHYFDSHDVNDACDRALANNFEVWFSGKLVWLTQEAIKNHLFSVRETCIIELAADIEGAGLLAHFDDGRGALCKDPAFVTELVATLSYKKGEHNKAQARIRRLQEEGPPAVLQELTGLIANACRGLNSQSAIEVTRQEVLRLIGRVLKKF
jgi:hypothetical protein